MTNCTVERLKALRRHYQEQRFFSQRIRRIRCGNFEIEAPQNHLLAHILPKQPLRDQGIGLAASHMAKKYPEGTFVDIGANIGDTAAIMASYAHNKLILVEPSDYFFPILSRNVKRFANEIVLVKTMISDGTPVSGELHHWAGTASISAGSKSQGATPTRKLSEIAPDSTRFVKLDTDGLDFKIISASLNWLDTVRPALMVEDQIRNSTDLQEANETFFKLADIGYDSFIVWDDPGLHVLSTKSIEAIRDLNHYLFQLWSVDRRKAIHNYDILCLHHTDADVFESMSAQCRA